jgi:hypothetical protein
MEYAIEKPSTNFLAVTDLDSDTWVGKVKRIRMGVRTKIRPDPGGDCPSAALREQHRPALARDGAQETPPARPPRHPGQRQLLVATDDN